MATRIQTLPPVWRPLWSPSGSPYRPKEGRHRGLVVNEKEAPSNSHTVESLYLVFDLQRIMCQIVLHDVYTFFFLNQKQFYFPSSLLSTLPPSSLLTSTVVFSGLLAQSYKASNPAGFSVLPGRRLLSPGIRFLCQAWVGQKTWTACRTGLFIKRRKKTGKSLCSLIPLIVSVSVSLAVYFHKCLCPLSFTFMWN